MGRWHRVVRVASVVALVGGLALLAHRLERTPEQEDLTHYVEAEVPSLRSLEAPVDAQLARLGQAPGLKPEEARKLLVDDVIPRLLKIKRQAADLPTKTGVTRALNREYLQVTDQLIDACRLCVQVIDDPKRSTLEGLKDVRARFAEVRKAYDHWDTDVREACVRNRLAKPQ